LLSLLLIASGFIWRAWTCLDESRLPVVQRDPLVVAESVTGALATVGHTGKGKYLPAEFIASGYPSAIRPAVLDIGAVKHGLALK
jgi:hypothetical protein